MNIDVWSLVIDFCDSKQKLRVGGCCDAASLAFGKIISRIEWRTIPYDIHPRLLQDYPKLQAMNEIRLFMAIMYEQQQTGNFRGLRRFEGENTFFS